MCLYGLTKTFCLKNNALCNMQLIAVGLKKIFSMDDKPFEEEMFKPLNDLYKVK